MSNEHEIVRDNSTQASASNTSALHTELQQQQIEYQLAAGRPGGGGFPAPHPEPPRPAPPPPRPMPRPEPPRPAPPPPRPMPRPEPPRPPAPRPPRPEPPHPPAPRPPRPEPGPHPPRPEPGPHPPRPEPGPHPPRPEPGPHPPRPEPGPHPPHPHPPRPEPGPEHPRPHPPRPEPGHGGFHRGHEYHPPEGRHWGWHDPDRWERGYDPWFYRQDPNWRNWRDPIRDAAINIAERLDYGDAMGAADELATDLYSMKGDRYAQDELLNEINQFDQKGLGADLVLNDWDPDRGTWDDIEVEPNDGTPYIPINVPDYGDPAPWDSLRQQRQD